MRTAKFSAEQIERELLDLKDGWRGAGSKAPSADAIMNVINHIACLPEPTIDVDRDGTIFARWSCPDSTRIFTLAFNGHQVINNLTLVGKAN